MEELFQPNRPMYCGSCGSKLQRMNLRDTGRFNKYSGAKIWVYDYRCPKYVAWNPFTWLHTGNTIDNEAAYNTNIKRAE